MMTRVQFVTDTVTVEVSKTDQPQEVEIKTDCQNPRGSNFSGRLVLTSDGAFLLWKALEKLFNE